MRKRMQKGAALLLALCLAVGLLSVPTWAAEPEQTDWDGYLFRVSADAPVLLSGTEGVEPVWPELGLYRAEAMADAVAFAGDQMMYAEPNCYVTLLDMPADPLCEQQWSLETLGVESAWDWGLDGTGVRIGIIDSGVMTEHEDLQGADILTGYNYLDGSTDVSDELGHGTFVTGLIAAQGGNGLGIAGLAEGAQIVPLKCFSTKNTTMDIIVSAIRDAVDTYDCDILNMSFGATFASGLESLKDAVEYAAETGAILVAAVGNTGGAALNYPAAFDCVIGVGSVNEELNVSTFSQRNASVYVTAPGENIQGLSIADSQYASGKGTSYSCPMVTAAIALLKQADSTLTRQEIMSLLADAATDLGEEGHDTSYGYGLVQMPALLRGMEALRPTALTVADGQLSVSGFGAFAPTDRIFAAAYRADGRMLACMPVASSLLLDSRFTLPDAAARVKLLVLSGTDFAPLRAPQCWAAQELPENSP